MYQKIKARNLLTTIDAVDSARGTDQEFAMELKDDSWVVMSKGEANVIMASVFVPRVAMAEYDRNNYDTVGIYGSKVKAFIEDEDDFIEMEMEQRTLHLRDGSASADLATINSDAIGGRIDKAPSIDHEVKVTGGFDEIIDFINRAEGMLNTGSYMIGAREDGVYLYTAGDNGKMSQRLPWDTFDGHEIDWSVNNKPPGEGHIPKKDKAIDAIMGIDYTKTLNTLEGDLKMAIGNHMPLRLLYETVGDDGNATGMKVNYYQTPRIDESDNAIIPDKVIEKER